MARRRLPSGLWSRGAATTRIAARVGRAAARRVLVRSDADDARLGEALLAELDRLKGTAMKVGQILSYLDVGLPPEVVARLEQLQEGVQPLDVEVVERAIEAQLGAPMSELFDRFESIPVAAASIGQVHRAWVDGAPVAVKVQYPDVREAMTTDLRQLHVLGRVASMGVAVDGPALVSELEERMLEECDYGREAGWQRGFAKAFADADDLVIPAVLDERSSRAVLTTNWWDATPLLRCPDALKADVIAALVRFPYAALFGHGVLHADPHPGNTRVLPDGRLVVFDFGCVRAFADDDVQLQRALLRATLDGDRVAFRSHAIEMGLAPRPERVDFDELYAMHRWMSAPYLSTSFRFERPWWEEGMRRFSRPSQRNLRHLGFPPAQLWVQRVQMGLHAVLIRLGAEGAFRDIVRGALDRRTVPLARVEGSTDAPGIH